MTRSSRSDWKPLIKICALGLALTGCLILVYATPIHEVLRPDKADKWREAIQRFGAWGAAIYVGAGAALVSAGFPRIAYHFIGGAIFGFLRGALWSHVGTMIGTLFLFWFARKMGRDWVAAKWGSRFAALENRLRRNAFVIVLLIRLSPVGNCFLTTCLCAVSSVSARSFFFSSLLGLLPQTLIYALLGSGVAKANQHQTGIAIAALIGIGVVVFFYYRYSRLGSSVADDLSESETAAAEEPEAVAPRPVSER